MSLSAPLVRVRFLTSRGGVCGVHLEGLEYDVPTAFAQQVVEQEQVADYVTVPASHEAGTRAKPKKR